MVLTPGTRLGVYEITAQIGVGGMGEVYRATDGNLKRQVAIKVLPASVAGDPDRLARFQREAEVLAALNHPNIAAIYGLEKPADVTALVMELVEGPTLAELIAGSGLASIGSGQSPKRKAQGLSLDDALPIAKQIAEALEAAHEQGIIHRDLKPANIKVRSDGTVKVLDFGLAKAMDSGAGGAGTAGQAGLSMSPTITSPAMTHVGMILGTAAYMAPEQAKGRSVERRADIWAFGAVLYEMLSGCRAFGGEDVSDTLASVLKTEPAWERLPADVPARIRQVLRACLQKDAKQRLGDMQSVRLALEGAFETAAPQTATLPATAPRSAVARVLPWVVTTASVVALGIAIWAPWRSERPVDRPLVRLNVDLGADAAFPSVDNLTGTSIAISPDGTRLVYVSGTPPRLFTRRLDQPTATELPGTRGAIRPFFSPDGQWVAFAVGVKVNKISVEGGAVVQVGAVTGRLAGASWSEDESIIVGDLGGKGLLQLPVAGGAPKILVAGDVVPAEPEVLPGGKAVVFVVAAGPGVDTYTIDVLSLADGRRKTLVRGGQSPRYVPSSNGAGYLLYINKATLFAIPFDLATLETRGTALPVLDDVAYSTNSGSGLLAVSRTGTLIYRRAAGSAAALTTMQWINVAGKKEPLRSTPGVYQNLRLSPDGKRVALVIREGANQDVWVYDPQRDALTRLTFSEVNGTPVWSPDGQYIVFQKGQGLFQARADGATQPQALTGTAFPVPWSFTPDGKRLAYWEGNQIWTVPLDEQGGQLKAGTPEPFLKSSFSDQVPSFSPDSRWLAYHSNESGRNEVYVRAFPPPSSGAGGKWQISNSGGAVPHWSRTGHELIYQSRDQLMTVSYTVNGTTFVADKPRVWIASLGGATGWDLAPDGQRVAAIIPEASTQPQQEHEIVMLQNFADELRRRVPLGK